jgi:hypothetical protein
MPGFDPTRLVTGWGLSNSDRTVTNVSAGNNVTKWSSYLVPLFTHRIYFEVVFNRSGGSNVAYIGLVPQTRIDNFDDGTNIGTTANFPGIGYGSSGIIFHNGITTTVTGSSYVNGDILMIAFDGFTGNFWTGKNGTWDRNPSSQAPRVSINPGTTPLTGWLVAATPRDQNDAYTIRRNASELSYSVPSGFVTLETLETQVEGISITKSVAYAVSESIALRISKSVFYAVSNLIPLATEINVPVRDLELELFPPQVVRGASVSPPVLETELEAFEPELRSGVSVSPSTLLYQPSYWPPAITFGGSVVPQLPAIHIQPGTILLWGVLDRLDADIWTPISTPDANIWVEIDTPSPDPWTRVQP